MSESGQNLGTYADVWMGLLESYTPYKVPTSGQILDLYQANGLVVEFSGKCHNLAMNCTDVWTELQYVYF